MIDLRNLSYEENETIREFRQRMEKEIDDPLMLGDETLYYRFLKARDFNIERAEKMLRKYILWRKAKQIQTLVTDFVPNEVYKMFLEPSFLGLDKNGDFISYVPAGKMDVRDILQCIKFNDYMDNFIWFTELHATRAINQAIKRGKDVKTYVQMILIFDLDQLTFSNATSKLSAELLLAVLHTLSNNYPESTCKIYVINAPRYYMIPFTILKSVMSNATLAKFAVFGKDGWKEALLKTIDADVLPAFLGGNKTDPDGNPLCKTFVNHGHVPGADYSLSEEERYFKDRTQIQLVSIPQNSRKEVDVDVAEVGSVIQWEFLVKNRDIGIGLFCKDLDVVEVLPVLRYYTTDGTTTISYKTKRAGKYILVFDNSYSWMKSKEVEYTVKVVKPEN